LNRSGGPPPTPFTSFPNITPIVTNPTQEAPIPLRVQSGPGPEPNPDHDSSSSDGSDDDDEIPPLADREIEDSSDDSDDEVLEILQFAWFLFSLNPSERMRTLGCCGNHTAVATTHWSWYRFYSS
jgi:hypothetical protein